MHRFCRIIDSEVKVLDNKEIKIIWHNGENMYTSRLINIRYLVC